MHCMTEQEVMLSWMSEILFLTIFLTLFILLIYYNIWLMVLSNRSDRLGIYAKKFEFRPLCHA